jgi:hypothetical protein
MILWNILISIYINLEISNHFAMPLANWQME